MVFIFCRITAKRMIIVENLSSIIHIQLLLWCHTSFTQLQAQSKPSITLSVCVSLSISLHYLYFLPMSVIRYVTAMNSKKYYWALILRIFSNASRGVLSSAEKSVADFHMTARTVQQKVKHVVDGGKCKLNEACARLCGASSSDVCARSLHITSSPHIKIDRL